MVTPSFMRQSAVHLLPPVHDLAQFVTSESTVLLPTVQSVGLTHAPAIAPHWPAPSPGGTDASAAPPDPAAPPVLGSPPAPDDVLDPVAPADPEDPIVDELPAPPLVVVVVAAGPEPCPASPHPPHARSTALESRHAQRRFEL
jgi:hypothetical protein